MGSTHPLCAPDSKGQTFLFIITATILTLTAVVTTIAEKPRSGPALQSDSLLKDSIPAVDASCMENVITSRQAKNLVPTPSFEDEIPSTVWHNIGKCDFSHDCTRHYEGSCSARIVGAQRPCYWQTETEAIPVEGGRYYDFSCRINSDLANGAANVEISFFDENKKPISGSLCSTSSVADTEEKWVEVTGSERAPSNAHYAQLKAKTSDWSDGSAWFDDCYLGLAVNLEIDKEGYSSSVKPGESLTYTITYSNSGRETATYVQVAENYAEEVTFKWADPQPEPNLEYHWNIDSLPPNTIDAITVVVEVISDTTSSVLVNYVQIDSPETKVISDVEQTEINVDGGLCLVSITSSDMSKDGRSGDEAIYWPFIRNVGVQPGVVTVSTDSSQNWQVIIEPPQPYQLSPGDIQPIKVRVIVPAQAHNGTVDMTTITTTIQCDTREASDPISFTTIAKELGLIYLPIILKPTSTELSVFNNNTGGNLTFVVRDLLTKEQIIPDCKVPNDTTKFCGTFPPGTYEVQAFTVCGGANPNPIAIKTYDSGPQITKVSCK